MKKVLYILIGAVVAFFAVEAFAAYGVKWTPGDESAVAGAYLTSESAFELRMRQPDGKIRRFHRDFEDPAKLYGDNPWVGEDMGGGAFRILTNPEFKGGRTAFVFINGHLRRMVFGRKDYKFETVPYPPEKGSIESLWPDEMSEESAMALLSTWKDAKAARVLVGRRIGYENPNKGGCLMAEIALVAVAVLFFARRKWLKALGAAAAVASFAMLVQTQSRGAFVALVLGVLMLAAPRVRSLFSWRRLLIAAGIVCIAAIVLVMSGVGTRFSSGLVNASSPSDALRVKIMKAAPAMMVDAPHGWGFGRSGWSYANWYQAPDEFRVVRTLVNSHLTWLVEFGWCGRVVYLGCLFALMFVLLYVAKCGGNPLPLALFAEFFTAGLFNSVMEAPTLWLLPCASLALLFLPPARQAITVRKTVAATAAGFILAGILVATLAYIGSKTRHVPLRAKSGGVVVNGRSAKTWVVDDNVVLGRGFLGRELRMFYATFPNTPPIGVVWRIEDVPEDVENIVVAGRRCEDFVAAFESDHGIAERFASITFISPPFAASTLPTALSGRPSFRVLQGELAVRLTPDAANPPPFLTVVPGAELYIPGWMGIVISKKGLPENKNTNDNTGTLQ